MTVVSNASPIINLDAVGHLDLIQRLYGDLLIPSAVHKEITAAPGEPGAKAVQSETWITRHSLNQRRLASALLGELDSGEAEAIALAVETEVELLLIDEQAGRRAAQRLEVEHVGTLGVLLEAKQAGPVSEIRHLLDALRSEAGFWISDALYKRTLELAGENDSS
jgi:predicted nucleic acid-binding protein